jgi:hypothetical protein
MAAGVAGPRPGVTGARPAAQRSRSRSCTRGGPSRMSRSRASGTRSRTPASTRGQRARRVRPAAHPDRAGRPRARRGRDHSMGSGTEADWARETRFWKEAGCSHVTLRTNFNRRHHRRIPGRTMGDHLTALRRTSISWRWCFVFGAEPRAPVALIEGKQRDSLPARARPRPSSAGRRLRPSSRCCKGGRRGPRCRRYMPLTGGYGQPLFRSSLRGGSRAGRLRQRSIAPPAIMSRC